jgi:two-component system sensor histidine kinase TctE
VLANLVHWDGSAKIALKPDALIWLLADEGDDVVFRVTDLGNDHVLTSNGDLGALPDLDIRTDEPYFRYVRVGAEKLRVAYVKRVVGPTGASALVEIGETTRKREAIAQGILIGTISIVSVFILATVALVWTGVSTTLQPLSELQADAARRSIDNLQPLETRNAPAEVLTLIATFNQMLGRVVDAMDAQRRFLANVAHQMKTPMAGLRLQAQLALSATSLEGARQNMQSVEQRAGHSAHLIDQLLSLARAETDHPGPLDTTCDFAAVAHAVIERLLPQARQRDIDLGFEQVGDPGRVAANPILVGELMTNLVDNALRYGRERGHVTVRLEHADATTRLIVMDDGPGLPVGSGERMFVRFWRCDSSNGEGAGLGLAIVKEIADRYGAVLSIASRPQYDGTRIDVSFHAA